MTRPNKDDTQEAKTLAKVLYISMLELAKLRADIVYTDYLLILLLVCCDRPITVMLQFSGGKVSKSCIHFQL